MHTQSQVLKEIYADIREAEGMDPDYHNQMKVFAGIFFGDTEYVKRPEAQKYLSGLESGKCIKRYGDKVEPTTWGEQLFYIYIGCLRSHIGKPKK